MVEMTVQVSEEVAEKIRPIRNWLSTVLEFSFIGFQTPAIQTATEIIQFLSTQPTPEEVLSYYVSDRAQNRLERLLALNQAGKLTELEELELDEIEKIEHVIIMLKTQIVKQLKGQN